MPEPVSNTNLVTVVSLREYFRTALHGALAHQRVAVAEQTEQYVVNLLTLYARTERACEGAPTGARLPALVQLFAAAAEAGSAGAREQALQRLGDLSLFLAGILADGCAHRLVDIDYHIAMGGSAYGTLAEALARGPRRVLARVYAELAAQFTPLVDALGELGEGGKPSSQTDLLRLYEVWLRTGSRRARARLAKAGVQPTRVALRAH